MKSRFPAFILCLLLICSVFIPTSLGSNVKNIPYQPMMSYNRGNTLYVGGSGPDNYTKIQDAIDNASEGDTVFVYSYSSPYYGNVEVDKSINLMGEEKYTTVIEGSGTGWFGVVLLCYDQVKISGFTIQNGVNGIYMESSYNTVTGNIILGTSRGIYIRSNYNTVEGNVISSITWRGILIAGYTYNTIVGNTIVGNTITSCGEYGIHVWNSCSTTIKGNSITLCGERSVAFYGSSNNNIIYHNNLIDNGERAYDECNNTWDDGKYGNYWSDYKERYPDAEKELFKPWMWNTPYEIEGGDNKDKCPLVNQWRDPRPKITSSFSSFWLRFLDMFPVMQWIL